MGWKQEGAHRDDSHDRQCAEGTGKHQTLRLPVLHCQEEGYEEGFVAELRKQNEQEPREKTLPDRRVA